jgi:hypothetical protein
MQAITETLPDIESRDEAYIVYSKDFGRPIGESKCVETGVDEVEPITYAKRKGRNGYTRFVRNRAPEPVNHCTVILKKDESSNAYILITAYFGLLASPEPWDPNADATARDFWNTHALVWDPDTVELRSVTNTCPW